MGFSTGPAPTKAEAKRMDLIPEAGCLACWIVTGRLVACEVHHLTIGGKHGAPRRGHAFTVGLCGWHHRGIPPLRAGPSYAREPSAFRRQFGDDAALLQLQSRRLAVVAATYLIRPVYV
jgi:RecA-dependent nuclease